MSTFYTHYLRKPPKANVVHVCRDLSCMLAGGREAGAAVRASLAARDDVEIHEVSCLGRCEAAPVCHVNDRTVALDAEAVAAEIDAAGSSAHDCATRAWAADIYSGADEHYATLRRVLEAGDREAPVAELRASGLRGMGGAGFPTATKWTFVAAETSTPKYVICNADESEPGTFKDRVILHDLPHLVIEGMILAGFAVGAERGTVFIRHEYGPERRKIEAAIEAARAAGVLGDRVCGADFRFDIDVFVSPGGYILGEETALLECMEDRRGEPRNKPPFPGKHGLHGKPTVINNVETFAHSVGIIGRGAAWWNELGTGDFAGHKFISVSGDVARPDVYLVAVGTTLRGLLDLAGGMAGGKRLAAIAPGGASSNFLPADKLDVPLSFETLAEAGSMLGSGAAVFVAEGHSLLEVGVNVASFFRNESCGKCVPCRVGSSKAVAMLEGKQSMPDGAEALLRELHTTMEQTSICGLGQVALAPLLSILDNLPDQVR